MIFVFIWSPVGQAQLIAQLEMDEASEEIEKPMARTKKKRKKKRKKSEYHFQWFNPSNYQNAFGYERAGVGILSENVINYSKWIDGGKRGYEIFAGFSKAADTLTTNQVTSTNSIAETQTITTTNTGQSNGFEITLGGGYKQKMYQSRWLQVYWGALGAVTYATATDFPVGTTVVVNDTTTPGDFTTTQTGVGSTQVETDLAFSLGLKVGTEFYLKWFPQLAIGFSSGLLTTMGGNTTTTTTTSNRAAATVGGVEQDPTTDSSSTQVVQNDRGISASTFGIGGTEFNLFGTFTIRYIW